jgi:GNAT superfamily N-acetyltransferase
MSSQFTFRAAEGSDAQQVSALVQQAFLGSTLPGWAPAAVDNLLAQNSPEALRSQFETAAFAHVCVSDGRVVGHIHCKLPRLISLLVVHPSFQRLGVGSQLLERALLHIGKATPEISVVEASATEFSLPFYRRRAFYPISEFIDLEGCRFVRMAFWRKSPLLSARLGDTSLDPT